MNDLISRQAAIGSAISGMTMTIGGEKWIRVSEVRESLYSVSSAQRKGKWIGTEFDGYADGYPVFYEWKCSECGCVFEDEEPTWNYCPHCGARMMKGDEDENNNQI